MKPRTVYYNEIDPYCCEWLRQLMITGLLPTGDIDNRSIADVHGEDLKGYEQCHFFAGIGGWPYALYLADWPSDRPVWTGSCPCQPFSVAGKRKGFGDKRHLWPEFYGLIAERNPPTVFGEQVAAASDWLSRVRSDLESLDYAVGALPIQAACAGAAQFRDRYWFVAERDCQRQGDEGLQRGWELGGTGCATEDTVGVMAPQLRPRLEEWQGEPPHPGLQRQTVERDCVLDLERPSLDGWGQGWTESEFRSRGFTSAVASLPDGAQFIECPDGKFRRLPPPRVRWLGNGIPSRVAKLRALGNSIYPPLAAEFIKAYLDCLP